MNPSFMVDFIKKYRRKMNFALFIEWCVITVAIGAGAALAAELTALIIPFYYVNSIAVLCLLLGLVSGVVLTIRKRYSMGKAALAIDEFGFSERIITAYENRDKEGGIYEFQREDALRMLCQNKDTVRFRFKISYYRLSLCSVLLIATIVVALIPSKAKTEASVRHQLQMSAQEKMDEIEEVIEALDEIDVDELDEQQATQIEGMKDSLMMSLEEMEGIQSGEDLADANAMENALEQARERLDYKYDEIAEQLSDISAEMAENMDVATTQEIQNALDKMGYQDVAGDPNSQNGQNVSDNQVSQNISGNQISQNVVGNPNSQNGQGISGNQVSQGVSGNQAGQTGEGNMTGQDGQDGQGNMTGQSGQNGQGNQNGQNGGEGNNGRGTGTADFERDYVSIPGELGQDESLHGQSTQNSDSEYYRDQNGLAWEGEHVDYNSVIMEYSNQAMESLEQGRYPSGMEDIIKEYFGSMN